MSTEAKKGAAVDCRMLSEKGNPRLDSLLPVLKALDFSLVVDTNKAVPSRR